MHKNIPKIILKPPNPNPPYVFLAMPLGWMEAREKLGEINTEVFLLRNLYSVQMILLYINS